MPTFKRLLAIVFGYLGACLVSGFVLTYATLAFGTKSGNIELSTLVFVTPFAAMVALYFSFVPSAIMIFISEILRRQDGLFYALSGGVCGFLIAAFVQFPMGRDSTYNGMGGPAVVVTGIIAGLAYWLFAGRRAGMWMPPAEPQAPTSPEP